MSKEYKNIDELFKTELGQNSAKAPAYVKVNIDKAITGKSNKWIFFLIPVVLLSVALPIYFWDNNMEINTAGRVTHTNHQNFAHVSNQNPSSTEAATTNSVQPNSVTPNGNLNPSNSTENVQQTNSVDLNNDKQFTVKPTPENLNGSNRSVNKVESKQLINPTKNDLTTTNSDKLNLSESKLKSMSDSIAITDQTTDLANNDNKLSENKTQNLIDKQFIDTTDNYKSAIDSTKTDREIIQPEKVDSSQIKDEIALIDSSLTQEALDTSSTVEIIKEDPKPKNWTIDLQAFGGLDFLQSKFTSISPEAIANFDNNKMKQMSSHFGLAGFVNYKNISIGTGASLYKLSDEAEYSYYNYSNTPMDSTQTSFFYVPIYDSTGMQIDSTLDSTSTTYNYTVLDSTAASSQVNNVYKIISIPLTLGYTFNFSSWAIKPRVSGIFEFTRQSTIGNYPVLGTGNSGLDQLQSLKFGFSLGLDLEVRKYFGQFYALMRPSYRIKLTNTANSSSSSIKHNAFNAVIGVGFHFGR